MNEGQEKGPLDLALARLGWGGPRECSWTVSLYRIRGARQSAVLEAGEALPPLL